MQKGNIDLIHVDVHVDVVDVEAIFPATAHVGVAWTAGTAEWLSSSGRLGEGGAELLQLPTV